MESASAQVKVSPEVQCSERQGVLGGDRKPEKCRWKRTPPLSNGGERTLCLLTKRALVLHGRRG